MLLFTIVSKHCLFAVVVGRKESLVMHNPKISLHVLS
jgi:hypothetical protein